MSSRSARKGKGTPEPKIDAKTLARYGADQTLIPLRHYLAKDSEGNATGKLPRKGWTEKSYVSANVIHNCVLDNSNVGWRLGREDLVLDIDPRNGGLESFAQLCHDAPLDESRFVKVISGRGDGGFHLYMKKPADMPTHETLPDYPGIEFKTIGRQVVAAGSLHHATGKAYTFDDGEGRPRIEDGVRKAPKALLRLIQYMPSDGDDSGGGKMTAEGAACLLDKLDPAQVVPDNDAFEDFAPAAKKACADADAEAYILDWLARDGSQKSPAPRWKSYRNDKPGGKGVGTFIYILKAHGVGQGAIDSVFGERDKVEAVDDFPDDQPGAADEFDAMEDDDGWLEGEKEPPKSRAYTETKLPALLDFAEACMIEQGAQLYQMGGRLVHPVRADKDSADDESIRRKAGSLTIGEVNQHRLREYVIDNVPFHKLDKKGKPTKYAAPMGFAAHYLARGDKWRVPNISGVIETPTLRRDGTIIDCDGYDGKSGLLLDMGGVEFPEIPDRPSRAQALEALALVKEPFAGFPFVTNAKGQSASRSVMLSAALTALVRRTLHSAPMHGTSAPTMGTGKTLAIDVVSLIATGRLTTAMSQGANEEEDEKRLFSVLLQNDLILLIDNVKRPIEGDALCTVLTQSTWQSRILGESRKVEVPTNALMLASGNNLTFKGDMTTRSLLCRMDAKMEKPETRRFKIDLKTWVPKHRVALVVAGLTVLRAFVVAGRPGLDKLTPFGRFEDWSNLVRGALVWLGEPDPCKTRSFIATDDPEQNDLGQLMAAIRDNAGGEEHTASELIKMGEDTSDSVLTDAIENAVRRPTPKTFGQYLHARNGKILEGLRLMGRYDTHLKTWKYQVRES
ncbi:bifunctional DNA primase/polymerase [Bradyrhizobium sp. AUGA SZCCT0158]|uniref:bifunctional DNA primase/polymerase n=1 Tax=Bradyrhizobium sp. AUGA SZCCT0158 TaxID=2807661 RepID=UPI001BACF8F4|nr:bifunctional DNA primase/polymerase [Bradyrhizobium sp. AUGA SZCCT0158]MBR1200023.1 bifunctional DNA primase/polymerase [Bradyrhizobium sp. AUGA SZCCT0158]